LQIFFLSVTDLQKVPFTPQHFINLFVILFDQLLAVDQLTAVRQSGDAFSELEESTPTFPPTFKVNFCAVSKIGGGQTL
jgi:hypothetical protein